ERMGLAALGIDRPGRRDRRSLGLVGAVDRRRPVVAIERVAGFGVAATVGGGGVGADVRRAVAALEAGGVEPRAIGGRRRRGRRHVVLGGVTQMRARELGGAAGVHPLTAPDRADGLGGREA